MNRKILFRGKRLDGDWVYGFLTCMNYIDVFNPKVCYDGQEEIRYYTVEHHQVDTNTVGQFTGLCDKNGNKIFEGDILETAGPDGADYQDVVHFGHFNDDDNHGNEYIGFYVKSGNYTTSLLEMPLGEHNYCYIIGNIYDNPELLEDIK